MVRTITTLVSSATFKTSLNPLFYLPQVWEGEGVIKYGRKLIGATDPQKSEPGTIRGDLAVVVGRYNLELFVFRLLNPCYLKFQTCKMSRSITLLSPPGFSFCYAEISFMEVMVRRLRKTRSACGSNRRSWSLTQAMRRSGSMVSTDPSFFCFLIYSGYASSPIEE